MASPSPARPAIADCRQRPMCSQDGDLHDPDSTLSMSTWLSRNTNVQRVERGVVGVRNVVMVLHSAL